VVFLLRVQMTVLDAAFSAAFLMHRPCKHGSQDTRASDGNFLASAELQDGEEEELPSWQNLVERRHNNGTVALARHGYNGTFPSWPLILQQ
jgi:hypothetical protein